MSSNDKDNCEDSLMANEPEEPTPIYDALYLEYRERMFKRILTDVQTLKQKKEQEK